MIKGIYPVPYAHLLSYWSIRSIFSPFPPMNVNIHLYEYKKQTLVNDCMIFIGTFKLEFDIVAWVWMPISHLLQLVYNPFFFLNLDNPILREE